jgi:probable rRNA maturation factor
MSRARQNIVVEVTIHPGSPDVNPLDLEELVKAVCKRFDVSNATVSIAIVDDAGFREMNSRFLNRKSTSDCLSFDLSEEGEPKSGRLFELVVNGEMAVRQAALRGHSSRAELALYVTHALLHNVGLDDSTERRAGEMHKIEDEILQQLGYGLVYNSRAKTKRRKRE